MLVGRLCVGWRRYSYIFGSGGTLLFDVTIVAQAFLYRGRRPLDPLISSASGYLPPRSVGMGGSLSASGIISRTSTTRSGQLRRTLSGRSVSTSRMGSIKTGTLHPSNLGHMNGDMPEREPLLTEPVTIEDQLGMPRYRSTSISERRRTDPPPIGGDVANNYHATSSRYYCLQ
jgi:hypothetical protein